MVNLHASKWFTVLVFIISLHPMSFAQVNEEWLARYNGKDNLFDGGHDVTVDAAGNVFITGQSVSEQTGSDFVTIKYDADGNELWSRSYNGSANLDDGGVSIAIDISGNVYVTGWSTVSENALAFATIKYSATGNELWVKSYIGPGDFRNLGRSLAIDAAGNVYVTGVSTGLGSGDDYATIKYDPSGNELWVKRYNGPANLSDSPFSIAVSPDGNSYVTGGSVGVGSGLDYATIKYDSYGNELWVRRYNGPGNSLDAAHKIILDDLQNVYLTGESVGLGTQSDFATIKLNAAGAELWIRRYNGPLNLTDQAFALGLDRGRNVYVAGRSNSHQQVGDYVTLKYDAAGQEQWVRTYDGPISGNDIPWALAVEPSGNAYVTGSSTGADGKPDYATIAYNTTGNELWVKRFGPVKDSIDQATAIAVDGSGNVYVTGNSSDVEGGDDIVTIKYSQPGVFRVDAGQDKVIYLGYGPDCVTLSANVSNGNPPYTFVWSPGGTQSASISVCPSITTTYTLRVIDATGNIAIDEVVVKVVDVRCENNKVVICHNGKELCVPGHAVEAHLKHGDQLGTINCSKTDDLEKSFRITITPNPFQNRTFIQYEVPENGRVLINIFDDKGRLVSVVANGERKAGVYTTDFNAANLHKGIYYYSAILFTSKKGFVRTGKMIKIK